MTVTQALAPHLPYLRRYARALTGSQQSGDAYVRAALTALAGGRAAHWSDDVPPRVGLYRLFHTIWSGTATRFDDRRCRRRRRNAGEAACAHLSAAKRAALLLTAVEAFSLEEAAAIVGETPRRRGARHRRCPARHRKRTGLRVMIIEDEPIIALDLENLVCRTWPQGGRHRRHARRRGARWRMQKQPGLILADINLGEGGSGIDAVTEILSSFDIPVIFITAYPEKLLTGERPEPTYLIAKPFLPETVQATVGQALFFHPMDRKAA